MPAARPPGLDPPGLLLQPQHRRSAALRRRRQPAAPGLALLMRGRRQHRIGFGQAPAPAILVRAEPMRQVEMAAEVAADPAVLQADQEAEADGLGQRHRRHPGRRGGGRCRGATPGRAPRRGREVVERRQDLPDQRGVFGHGGGLARPEGPRDLGREIPVLRQQPPEVDLRPGQIPARLPARFVKLVHSHSSVLPTHSFEAGSTQSEPLSAKARAGAVPTNPMIPRSADRPTWLPPPVNLLSLIATRRRIFG